MALRFNVVSADDHVEEPPDLWTSRLSQERWGDRIPHITTLPDGVERWTIDGRLKEDRRLAATGALAEERFREPQKWSDVPAAAYDPEARLATRYAVFSDGAADTILVRGEDAVSGAGHGKAEIAVVARGGDAGFDPADVLRLLHDRGHHAVFVEGGGVTVSSFLAAGALDRLQITVAPLIIGSGTPGITLPVIDDLAEGLRPPARVFPMGDDILFDCDMLAT